ncbi:galactitol-1-phosphate 5-dehydrogenase [Bacillaceae bacterium Marseille-Q3522]|nr:galactitol-1-phosphate 5-dehydrogenase [Bacillaceae bacterium Marseille-Q3522]
MKAVQMKAVKQLQVVDVEKPVPKEDEVLLKIMAVGVCGSDIPRINKYGPHVLPIIPGHEFAGEIVALGNKVSGWKVKDRVCVAPLVPCNKCKWCKNGNYSLCEDYQYYGSRNNGAMAEYLAVKADNLVKFEDNIPFDWGATVDPAANAIHAFLRGNVTKEDSLCVFGMGAIGLFAVQYGKALGIETIIAVDINEEKLNAAKDCGASFVINSIKENVINKIKALTNGNGVSAVMDMSGVPFAQLQGIQIAGKMGRIILLGISHAGLELPKETVSSILRKQLSIIGSWNSFSHPFPGKEWTEAVKLMAEGKLNSDKLITQRLKLADIPETFRKIDEEPFHFNKIMFYPNGF